jgi:hypothetical protein
VLRVVRRVYGDEERYTAYTRSDSAGWVRGGTWVHRLGADLRIGLVAMNRAGFTARFERVTVHRLPPYPCEDPALADPCRDSPPAEVERLHVEPEDGGGSGASRVLWDPAARAAVYDVSRAALEDLDGRDYGPCLADDLLGTELIDPDLPEGGGGFGYLVRGAEPLCAWSGPWGGDRRNEHPDACP